MGATCPPAAEILKSGPTDVAANKMSPDAFQAPPLGAARVRVCGLPPFRSSRFTVASAKKATERLSGDQNG